MEFRFMFIAFLMTGCVFCNTSAKMDKKLLQKVLGEIEDLLNDKNIESDAETTMNTEEEPLKERLTQQNILKDLDDQNVESDAETAKNTEEEPLTERLVRQYNLEGLKTSKKFGDGFMAFIHEIQAWINGNSTNTEDSSSEDLPQQSQVAEDENSTEKEESSVEASPQQAQASQSENSTKTEESPSEASPQQAQVVQSGSSTGKEESSPEASPQQAQVVQTEEKAYQGSGTYTGYQQNQGSGTYVEKELNQASDPSIRTNVKDDQETKKFKSELLNLLDTFMENRKAQKKSEQQLKPIESQTKELKSRAVVAKVLGRLDDLKQKKALNVENRGQEIDTVMNELDNLIDSIKSRKATNQA